MQRIFKTKPTLVSIRAESVRLGNIEDALAASDAVVDGGFKEKLVLFLLRPGKWVGSIGFGFDPCGFGSKNGSS